MELEEVTKNNRERVTKIKKKCEVEAEERCGNKRQKKINKAEGQK